MPDQQVINELTPLNVSASATDPDIPVNPRTFSLVSPPNGMTIDPNTGAMAWTPSEGQGPLTNTIMVVVTDTNPPAVNATSISVTNSFTVIVREVNVAPQLTVPGNQTITELTSLNVSASATDGDLPANALAYSLVLPPGGMTINPNTGAIAWTPTEAQDSNSYTVTVMVTDNSPEAVNTQQLSDTKFFVVTVNESNSPPRFTSVPASQVITELSPLNVSVAAVDDDLPLNPLTFALVSPPSGMTINTNTGAITWTPTEAQGSNFYTITVTVTDTNATAINQKQFTVATNFTLTVNESNSPPRFTSFPGSQSITELSPLNLSVTGVDDDLPANGLTYALISPPFGMNINASSGAITWTPTEAQGSNFYTITVTLADTNPPAINQKQFIITNSFTVTVNESNSPPVLTVPGPQTLDELTPLNIAASATDTDFPANPLTYALVSPPPGMNINPNNGAIAWTPTEAQGPGIYTIAVTVTDTNRDANNQKEFMVTNSFTVSVNESNNPPRFTSVPGSQIITELSPLTLSVTGVDDDLPANVLTYALISPPSGMSINASSGAITWTPTEAQGSNYYSITVTVTDTNPAAINQKQFTLTTNFTVIVNESNSPPRFTSSPGNQNITEETLLSVSVAATDDDEPANALTFALVSPPAGMNINSGNGAITWTPTEAQGSNFYTITVTVTDTNPFAFNTKQLSVTNTFSVTVNESNRPPMLDVLTNRSLHYGLLLSVQVVATDPDLPTNTLAFNFDQSPTGMTVNASSGLIHWTPAQSQVGTHPVTVRVTDNGTPALGATRTFQVTVTGEGTSLAISRITGSNLKQLDISGDIGLRYELQISTNLMDWSRLTDFILDTSPYQYIDPASATAPRRFYRLRLSQ